MSDENTTIIIDETVDTEVVTISRLARIKAASKKYAPMFIPAATVAAVMAVSAVLIKQLDIPASEIEDPSIDQIADDAACEIQD